MDDFAAQVRAINAESKAAVEAGAPALQRLAKCFAGAPADAGERGSCGRFSATCIAVAAQARFATSTI
ncbi:hypothetical protein OH491_27430 (plasmid) [Termitidicoccus mucosus]|uniref:hypothetical protein n=1 Tax=Termitidicoccus mucosus TaxID=1184151 RepID=UPI003182E736